MKQLTEYIYKQIINNIRLSNEKNVIRVEGFDDIDLYCSLCEKIETYCKENNIDLIAKLALNKYNQLSPGSLKSSEKMKLSKWVDFEDHMTSYRNIVPENDQNLLILMLGTDMVADKGGLNDFYAITPHSVDRNIGKNYMALMGEKLCSVFDQDQIGVVVNTFFGELFSKVPQNLSKVSAIMDRWEDGVSTIHDVICELYRELPAWQIPVIIDYAENLSPAKMAKQTNSIIKNAYDFIQGKTYKKVSKSTLAGIKKKFDKYREESGKYVSSFPQGQEMTTFDELEQVVLSYVSGDHSEQLHKKILNTDFSIIESVLKIKTKKGIEPPDKETRATGSPLIAICGAMMDFLYENHADIEKINVHFTLSNMAGLPSGVLDKEELASQIIEKWRQICAFAGGIMEFICDEVWPTNSGKPLEIEYEPQGFFDPAEAQKLYDDGSIVKGNGGKHRIHFQIEAEIEGKKNSKKYCWYIDPLEDWMMAFNDFSIMPDEESSYIPFGLLKEINGAFLIKDEEGFAYWYDHQEKSFISDNNGIVKKLQNKMGDLSREEQYEIVEFYELGKKFSNLRRAILEHGFYSTIKTKTAELIDSYIKLANRVAFSSVYTNKTQRLVQLFMNAFSICASVDPLYNTGYEKQYITPPYHPTMLEKISDQMIFIRTGLKEWAQRTLYSQSPRKRIDELVSLTAVHNATDAYFKSATELESYNQSFGYYILYGDIVKNSGFVSAFEIQRQETVFDDDFDDSEMKIITRESEVLLHVLNDYTETYPQGKEHFNVVFINPSNLQYVVSALYQYVLNLQGLYKEDTFVTIQMTIITRNEMYGARMYLSYWINHVFSADDNLDMKVYLKVYQNEREIPRLIPSSTDLAFYFDALDTEHQAVYSFMPGVNTDQEQMIQCRFPMVFKPSVAVKGSLQHSIFITQPQFRAATAHTQVLRMYRDHQNYDFTAELVQVSNLNPDRGNIIKLIQDKVVWLACIDSAMDKNTVRKLYADETGIIGFTTGEGSFGQMNIALTCRQAIADDIMKRCARRIHQMFPGWSEKEIKAVAKFCMKKARDMDGVSILRAMNPSDYDVNNFLAYLIADELTLKSEKKLNILIRLDSYRHWFRDQRAGETKIPDFLLLQADLIHDQKLHLEATVIEAKIAGCITMEYEHIPKAKRQVKEGLSVLKEHFNPGNSSVEHRYWLAQLYRAIVFLQSDLDINEEDYRELTLQMNMMVEGDYEIEWHGEIMACEIDNNSSIIESNLEYDGLNIIYKRIGQLAIKNILMNQPLGTNVVFDPDATDQDEQSTFVEEETDDDTLDTAPLEIESEQTEIIDLKNYFQKNDSIGGTVGYTLTKAAEKPDEHSEICQYDEEEHEHAEDPGTTSQTETVKETESKQENNHVDITEARVLIGKDQSNKNIYWEFGHPQLANRHLLITGGSGQGKTYAIQTFLYELSKQNISGIVFDYTDGFLPDKMEPQFTKAMEGKIDHCVAILNRIPINPFKSQMIELSGFNVTKNEPSSQTASRFASIMKHVYKLGEQQYSTLYNVCKEGIDIYGDKMNFKHLENGLKQIDNNYARSILNKMSPLIDQDLFDTENAFDWTTITDRGGKITVIQLTSLDRETQTIITEMLMWDAWYSLTKVGRKDRPFVVVLDEAQNLSFADKSPAQKILQEGRKYGWSAWFATQFLKGALSSDEISRVQQAAEILYFKPANEEVNAVAQMLGDEYISSGSWISRIKHMQKGTCIVQGDRLLANGKFGAVTATMVKVSSFEDRN